MTDSTPRIIKIGDAISQLVNVLLLPNHKQTTANESISGRAHRCGWVKTEKVINKLFSPWEPEHCKASYLADVERARAMLETYK